MGEPVSPSQARALVNPVLIWSTSTSTSADVFRRNRRRPRRNLDPTRRPQDPEPRIGNEVAALKDISWLEFRGESIGEENLLAAKAWEFGYAMGASRPLAPIASGKLLHFLPGKFYRRNRTLWRAWGAPKAFGLHETSHYHRTGDRWKIPVGSKFVFRPASG